MSRHVASQQFGSFLITVIISGLSMGVTVLLVLSAIGVGWIETLVFSIILGGASSAFVYRERSLMAEAERSKTELQLEIDRQVARIDSLYDESLVCLAYFDAGTLAVDRVSPGLLKALRIGADTETRGRSIADLLRVPESSLEVVVSDAHYEPHREQIHELLSEDALGRLVRIAIFAHYRPEVHMVDASIFFVPESDREEIEEIERTKKDLDRFRKGLYRRENRILELKEEVNQALRETGERPRYQTDWSSDDSNLEVLESKVERKSGGLDE